jgi:excisionase family DNA binding protein
MTAHVAMMLHQTGAVRSLRARYQTHPSPDLAEFLSDLDEATEAFLAGRARATKYRAETGALASSLLSVAEVAVELGVEESTVRRAIKEGRLDIVSSKPYRISREALPGYRPRVRHEAHTEHTAADEAQNHAAE